MCDSTKDHCVQVPWKYIKVCGYSDLFCQKTWTKGHWPLDDLWPPQLLRSHVWLYPRIIVSKSHENTSKYVDTVNLFAKTWTKGHWPLDDLLPHICWGQMCDSIQGSLCPSPMGIHECMWIQWSILQITTYIHILHTTYILRTESVITKSLSELRSDETIKHNIYLLTPESVRIRVIGVRIFFRSQTLTDLSSDPLTTLSPDANMADVTELKMKE